MLDLLAWTAAGCGLLLTLLWLWIRRWDEELGLLPPGPPRVPILGNLMQIRGAGIDQLRHVAELVKQYGVHGVATLKFGPRRTIFITDYETIKRVLNDDVFSARPRSVLRDSFFNRQGLVFTDAELAKEHRRFALTTLRDFGMGKTWLQDTIVEEAQELLSDIRAWDGKPVSPTDVITPSVANVICAISYGQRFSHTDERFRQMASLVSDNIRLTSKTNLIEYFPFLRLIPFTRFHDLFEKWTSNSQRLVAFMQSLVDEHKSNFRPGNDEPTDYIDAYLKQQHDQKNNLNSTFTDRQLLLSIVNLFGAGTETTSTTLSWAIIYLLENREVLMKLQKEIDGVLGDRALPTMKDKDSLPYTQGTILEVQRMGNLVPIVGRSPTVDFELNGYIIPKGSTVAAITPAVHENPRYFPEPQRFKPERFLDADGQVLHKVDGFMPFGLGKRFCLGESLAKMELFLFFVTLVKNFDFSVPPGEVISTKVSVMSIVNTPKPYKISFLPRS
ncbi:hypothetical protein RvY_12025 [Ramazzottius varieornatus]|uniref:Cytochrome P450 n=1 Tax=Ramazzottius varieornatus TaxID=947166 RepID=A0A1D1VNH3_RAMVA|nr:hypothetical protein RvY_12025 [Ramazzottius varieornatus]